MEGGFNGVRRGRVGLRGGGGGVRVVLVEVLEVLGVVVVMMVAVVKTVLPMNIPDRACSRIIITLESTYPSHSVKQHPVHRRQSSYLT